MSLAFGRGRTCLRVTRSARTSPTQLGRSALKDAVMAIKHNCSQLLILCLPWRKGLRLGRRATSKMENKTIRYAIRMQQ